MSTSGGRAHVDSARWTPVTEVLLIDLVYEEVLRGNFLRSTFTQTVWKDLSNTLNHISGKCYSPRQCREKLARIKLHWGKFRTVMQSDTGLRWDSERELPTASDNWWAIWEEAHPKDVGLKKRPCRRYEKLCSIFARNTATGNRARSSAQVPPMPQNENIDFDFETAGLEIPTTSEGGATFANAFSSKRRKNNLPALDRLVDSFQKSSNSITSRLDEAAKEKQNKKTTISECVASVRALPGVTVDMIVSAVQYFKEEDNRLLFLELNETEQIALVKKIAR